MPTEKEWVNSLCPRIKEALVESSDENWRIEVSAGQKLTYTSEILLYHNDGSRDHHHANYETDILIYDIRDNGDWLPRVVVECKLGSVTTHDALTYSTKASTHKHVHPYLRYGTLIGAFDDALPGRLIRHGAYFDFMMVWSEVEASADEWSDLTRLLAEEVVASRNLQALLTESRVRSRKRFRLLHRPLRLSGTIR